MTFPSLALALMSCAEGDHAAVQTREDVAFTDSLRAEMQVRFGSTPDTLDVRNGARMRLVYVDTSGRDISARPMEAAYKEDSLQYDRAFDQAVWLWTTVAKRDGVDTVSVRYLALEASHGSPLRSVEYYFYSKQLGTPAVRPVLDREAVGRNQSDTPPSHGRLEP